MDGSGRTTISSRQTRERDVRGYILFAFAVALTMFLAYLMREILLMLYVSALFAVVLMPVTRSVMKLHIMGRHPNRAVAIVLLVLASAGAIATFFALALPPVLSDFSTFAKELPTRGPRMLNHLRSTPLTSHLNVSALNAKLQGLASNFAEYMILSVSSWATKVADIVTVIVLTIYFMLEGEIAYRWGLSLFPPRMRQRLDSTLIRAEVRMGKWLLGQGALMLIMGVSSVIAFSLLKIRYAYALGVLMGVLNIIPVVGGLTSMALVLVVAAVDSWTKVLGALIFYLAYVQFETSYLTPRIMQSSVDLAGLAVLVALLMGSKLVGVTGAMVAVPTAVLIAALVQEYLVQRDPVP